MKETIKPKHYEVRPTPSEGMTSNWMNVTALNETHAILINLVTMCVSAYRAELPVPTRKDLSEFLLMDWEVREIEDDATD